jgi:ADP-heptose:LPS heptosyltransferase
MKPRLLVVELWGLGDLIIATPFLQAASNHFDVTLLAKPYARDLQARFWPGVKVIPFVAPWTAFKGKYRLFSWPWREFFRLRRLRREHFEFGMSARWDPRDHLLLSFAGAAQRVGFPRMGSQLFLTSLVERPDPASHRYENWQVMARALGFALPRREDLPCAASATEGEILIHTGAGQAVRVWPLEQYQRLVARLREKNFQVRVACDPEQLNWWQNFGEKSATAPRTVTELLGEIDRSVAFIGNDSGPGHLAAACGVPVLTIFGPQLREWFAPLHPLAESIQGKACPYKPCSDYCRFPAPLCMMHSTEEIWSRVEPFLARAAIQAGAPI